MDNTGLDTSVALHEVSDIISGNGYLEMNAIIVSIL